MVAISIRDVTKTYGTHRAVDALTLTVPRGSVYGFIGPNGSGKSTTLRMIMNLIEPDCGEISVLGERTTSSARDRVGYLPEERGLYKKLRVRETLRYFGALKGATPRAVNDSIDRWLLRLGLEAWGDKRVEALSKGMAQKVQFIAAVVAGADLLILDEPFSGLDPVNMESLKDAILELRADGTTIVFSTHDMPVAEKMCDRVFMIHRGRTVLDGTMNEIQARYGADTLVVSTAAGVAALADIPEVESVNDYGQRQEVRFRGDPQAILRRLVERTDVRHFELARPTLHDIFVRIAGPGAVVSAVADAAPRGVAR